MFDKALSAFFLDQKCLGALKDEEKYLKIHIGSPNMKGVKG